MECPRFGEVNMRRLITLIFICLALVSTGAVWVGNKNIDIDGDGYKEAQVLYSGNQIVKTLIDTYHDGFKDTVIYYKNGYREHAEQDTNRDGKADRWVYYYFTGVAWKVAEDLNKDGE